MDDNDNLKDLYEATQFMPFNETINIINNLPCDNSMKMEFFNLFQTFHEHKKDRIKNHLMPYIFMEKNFDKFTTPNTGGIQTGGGNNNVIDKKFTTSSIVKEQIGGKLKEFMDNETYNKFFNYKSELNQEYTKNTINFLEKNEKFMGGGKVSKNEDFNQFDLVYVKNKGKQISYINESFNDKVNLITIDFDNNEVAYDNMIDKKNLEYVDKRISFFNYLKSNFNSFDQKYRPKLKEMLNIETDRIMNLPVPELNDKTNSTQLLDWSGKTNKNKKQTGGNQSTYSIDIVPDYLLVTKCSFEQDTVLPYIIDNIDNCYKLIADRKNNLYTELKSKYSTENFIKKIDQLTNDNLSVIDNIVTNKLKELDNTLGNDISLKKRKEQELKIEEFLIFAERNLELFKPFRHDHKELIIEIEEIIQISQPIDTILKFINSIIEKNNTDSYSERIYKYQIYAMNLYIKKYDKIKIVNNKDDNLTFQKELILSSICNNFKKIITDCEFFTKYQMKYVQCTYKPLTKCYLGDDVYYYKKVSPKEVVDVPQDVGDQEGLQETVGKITELNAELTKFQNELVQFRVPTVDRFRHELGQIKLNQSDQDNVLSYPNTLHFIYSSLNQEINGITTILEKKVLTKSGCIDNIIELINQLEKSIRNEWIEKKIFKTKCFYSNQLIWEKDKKLGIILICTYTKDSQTTKTEIVRYIKPEFKDKLEDLSQCLGIKEYTQNPFIIKKYGNNIKFTHKNPQEIVNVLPQEIFTRKVFLERRIKELEEVTSHVQGGGGLFGTYDDDDTVDTCEQLNNTDSLTEYETDLEKINDLIKNVDEYSCEKYKFEAYRIMTLEMAKNEEYELVKDGKMVASEEKCIPIPENNPNIINYMLILQKKGIEGICNLLPEGYEKEEKTIARYLIELGFCDLSANCDKIYNCIINNNDCWKVEKGKETKLQKLQKLENELTVNKPAVNEPMADENQGGGARYKWENPKDALKKKKLDKIKKLCEQADFWHNKNKKSVSVNRFTNWLRETFKDEKHEHVSGDEKVIKQAKYWLDLDLLNPEWNDTYKEVIDKFEKYVNQHKENKADTLKQIQKIKDEHETELNTKKNELYNLQEETKQQSNNKELIEKNIVINNLKDEIHNLEYGANIIDIGNLGSKLVKDLKFLLGLPETISADDDKLVKDVSVNEVIIKDFDYEGFTKYLDDIVYEYILVQQLPLQLSLQGGAQTAVDDNTAERSDTLEVEDKNIKAIRVSIESKFKFLDLLENKLNNLSQPENMLQGCNTDEDINFLNFTVEELDKIHKNYPGFTPLFTEYIRLLTKIRDNFEIRYINEYSIIKSEEYDNFYRENSFWKCNNDICEHPINNGDNIKSCSYCGKIVDKSAFEIWLETSKIPLNIIRSGVSTFVNNLIALFREARKKEHADGVIPDHEEERILQLKAEYSGDSILRQIYNRGIQLKEAWIHIWNGLQKMVTDGYNYVMNIINSPQTTFFIKMIKSMWSDVNYYLGLKTYLEDGNYMYKILKDSINNIPDPYFDLSHDILNMDIFTEMSLNNSEITDRKKNFYKKELKYMPDIMKESSLSIYDDIPNEILGLFNTNFFPEEKNCFNYSTVPNYNHNSFNKLIKSYLIPKKGETCIRMYNLGNLLIIGYFDIENIKKLHDDDNDDKKTYWFPSKNVDENGKTEFEKYIANKENIEGKNANKFITDFRNEVKDDYYEYNHTEIQEINYDDDLFLSQFIIIPEKNSNNKFENILEMIFGEKKWKDYFDLAVDFKNEQKITIPQSPKLTPWEDNPYEYEYKYTGPKTITYNKYYSFGRKNIPVEKNRCRFESEKTNGRFIIKKLISNYFITQTTELWFKKGRYSTFEIDYSNFIFTALGLNKNNLYGKLCQREDRRHDAFHDYNSGNPGLDQWIEITEHKQFKNKKGDSKDQTENIIRTVQIFKQKSSYINQKYNEPFSQLNYHIYNYIVKRLFPDKELKKSDKTCEEIEIIDIDEKNSNETKEPQMDTTCTKGIWKFPEDDRYQKGILFNFLKKIINKIVEYLNNIDIFIGNTGIFDNNSFIYFTTERNDEIEVYRNNIVKLNTKKDEEWSEVLKSSYELEEQSSTLLDKKTESQGSKAVIGKKIQRNLQTIILFLNLYLYRSYSKLQTKLKLNDNNFKFGFHTELFELFATSPCLLTLEKGLKNDNITQDCSENNILDCKNIGQVSQHVIGADSGFIVNEYNIDNEDGGQSVGHKSNKNGVCAICLITQKNIIPTGTDLTLVNKKSFYLNKKYIIKEGNTNNQDLNYNKIMKEYYGDTDNDDMYLICQECHDNIKTGLTSMKCPYCNGQGCSTCQNLTFEHLMWNDKGMNCGDDFKHLGNIQIETPVSCQDGLFLFGAGVGWEAKHYYPSIKAKAATVLPPNVDKIMETWQGDCEHLYKKKFRLLPEHVYTWGMHWFYFIRNYVNFFIAEEFNDNKYTKMNKIYSNNELKQKLYEKLIVDKHIYEIEKKISKTIRSQDLYIKAQVSNDNEDPQYKMITVPKPILMSSLLRACQFIGSYPQLSIILSYQQKVFNESIYMVEDILVHRQNTDKIYYCTWQPKDIEENTDFEGIEYRFIRPEMAEITHDYIGSISRIRKGNIWKINDEIVPYENGYLIDNSVETNNKYEVINIPKGDSVINITGTKICDGKYQRMFLKPKIRNMNSNFNHIPIWRNQYDKKFYIMLNKNNESYCWYIVQIDKEIDEFYLNKEGTILNRFIQGNTGSTKYIYKYTDNKFDFWSVNRDGIWEKTNEKGKTGIHVKNKNKLILTIDGFQISRFDIDITGIFKNKKKELNLEDIGNLLNKVGLDKPSNVEKLIEIRPSDDQAILEKVKVNLKDNKIIISTPYTIKSLNYQEKRKKLDLVNSNPKAIMRIFNLINTNGIENLESGSNADGILSQRENIQNYAMGINENNEKPEDVFHGLLESLNELDINNVSHLNRAKQILKDYGINTDYYEQKITDSQEYDISIFKHYIPKYIRDYILVNKYNLKNVPKYICGILYEEINSEDFIKSYKDNNSVQEYINTINSTKANQDIKKQVTEAGKQYGSVSLFFDLINDSSLHCGKISERGSPETTTYYFSDESGQFWKIEDVSCEDLIKEKSFGKNAKCTKADNIGQIHLSIDYSLVLQSNKLFWDDVISNKFQSSAIIQEGGSRGKLEQEMSSDEEEMSSDEEEMSSDEDSQSINDKQELPQFSQVLSDDDEPSKKIRNDIENEYIRYCNWIIDFIINFTDLSYKDDDISDYDPILKFSQINFSLKEFLTLGEKLDNAQNVLMKWIIKLISPVWWKKQWNNVSSWIWKKFMTITSLGAAIGAILWQVGLLGAVMSIPGVNAVILISFLAVAAAAGKLVGDGLSYGFKKGKELLKEMKETINKYIYTPLICTSELINSSYIFLSAKLKNQFNSNSMGGSAARAMFIYASRVNSINNRCYNADKNNRSSSLNDFENRYKDYTNIISIVNMVSKGKYINLDNPPEWYEKNDFPGISFGVLPEGKVTFEMLGNAGVTIDCQADSDKISHFVKNSYSGFYNFFLQYNLGVRKEILNILLGFFDYNIIKSKLINFETKNINMTGGGSSRPDEKIFMTKNNDDLTCAYGYKDNIPFSCSMGDFDIEKLLDNVLQDVDYNKPDTDSTQQFDFFTGNDHVKKYKEKQFGGSSAEKKTISELKADETAAKVALEEANKEKATLETESEDQTDLLEEVTKKVEEAKKKLEEATKLVKEAEKEEEMKKTEEAVLPDESKIVTENNSELSKHTNILRRLSEIYSIRSTKEEKDKKLFRCNARVKDNIIPELDVPCNNNVCSSEYCKYQSPYYVWIGDNLEKKTYVEDALDKILRLSKDKSDSYEGKLVDLKNIFILKKKTKKYDELITNLKKDFSILNEVELDEIKDKPFTYIIDKLLEKNNNTKIVKWKVNVFEKWVSVAEDELNQIKQTQGGAKKVKLNQIKPTQGGAKKVKLNVMRGGRPKISLIHKDIPKPPIDINNLKYPIDHNTWKDLSPDEQKIKVTDFYSKKDLFVDLNKGIGIKKSNKDTENPVEKTIYLMLKFLSQSDQYKDLVYKTIEEATLKKKLIKVFDYIFSKKSSEQNDNIIKKIDIILRSSEKKLDYILWKDLSNKNQLSELARKIIESPQINYETKIYLFDYKVLINLSEYWVYSKEGKEVIAPPVLPQEQKLEIEKKYTFGKNLDSNIYSSEFRDIINLLESIKYNAPPYCSKCMAPVVEKELTAAKAAVEKIKEDFKTSDEKDKEILNKRIQEAEAALADINNGIGLKIKDITNKDDCDNEKTTNLTVYYEVYDSQNKTYKVYDRNENLINIPKGTGIMSTVGTLFDGIKNIGADVLSEGFKEVRESYGLKKEEGFLSNLATLEGDAHHMDWGIRAYNYLKGKGILRRVTGWLIKLLGGKESLIGKPVRIIIDFIDFLIKTALVIAGKLAFLLYVSFKVGLKMVTDLARLIFGSGDVLYMAVEKMWVEGLEFICAAIKMAMKWMYTGSVGMITGTLASVLPKLLPTVIGEAIEESHIFMTDEQLKNRLNKIKERGQDQAKMINNDIEIIKEMWKTKNETVGIHNIHTMSLISNCYNKSNPESTCIDLLSIDMLRDKPEWMDTTMWLMNGMGRGMAFLIDNFTPENYLINNRSTKRHLRTMFKHSVSQNLENLKINIKDDGTMNYGILTHPIRNFETQNQIKFRNLFEFVNEKDSSSASFWKNLNFLNNSNDMIDDNPAVSFNEFLKISKLLPNYQREREGTNEKEDNILKNLNPIDNMYFINPYVLDDEGQIPDDQICDSILTFQIVYTVVNILYLIRFREILWEEYNPITFQRYLNSPDYNSEGNKMIDQDTIDKICNKRFEIIQAIDNYLNSVIPKFNEKLDVKQFSGGNLKSKLDFKFYNSDYKDELKDQKLDLKCFMWIMIFYISDRHIYYATPEGTGMKELFWGTTAVGIGALLGTGLYSFLSNDRSNNIQTNQKGGLPIRPQKWNQFDILKSMDNYTKKLFPKNEDNSHIDELHSKLISILRDIDNSPKTYYLQESYNLHVVSQNVLPKLVDMCKVQTISNYIENSKYSNLPKFIESYKKYFKLNPDRNISNIVKVKTDTRDYGYNTSEDTWLVYVWLRDELGKDDKFKMKQGKDLPIVWLTNLDNQLGLGDKPMVKIRKLFNSIKQYTSIKKPDALKNVIIKQLKTVTANQVWPFKGKLRLQISKPPPYVYNRTLNAGSISIRKHRSTKAIAYILENLVTKAFDEQIDIIKFKSKKDHMIDLSKKTPNDIQTGGGLSDYLTTETILGGAAVVALASGGLYLWFNSGNSKEKTDSSRLSLEVINTEKDKRTANKLGQEVKKDLNRLNTQTILDLSQTREQSVKQVSEDKLMYDLNYDEFTKIYYNSGIGGLKTKNDETIVSGSTVLDKCGVYTYIIRYCFFIINKLYIQFNIGPSDGLDIFKLLLCSGNTEDEKIYYKRNWRKLISTIYKIFESLKKFISYYRVQLTPSSNTSIKYSIKYGPNTEDFNQRIKNYTIDTERYTDKAKESTLTKDIKCDESINEKLQEHDLIHDKFTHKERYEPGKEEYKKNIEQIKYIYNEYCQVYEKNSDEIESTGMFASIGNMFKYLNPFKGGAGDFNATESNTTDPITTDPIKPIVPMPNVTESNATNPIASSHAGETGEETSQLKSVFATINTAAQNRKNPPDNNIENIDQQYESYINQLISALTNNYSGENNIPDEHRFKHPMYMQIDSLFAIIRYCVNEIYFINYENILKIASDSIIRDEDGLIKIDRMNSKKYDNSFTQNISSINIVGDGGKNLALCDTIRRILPNISQQGGGLFSFMTDALGLSHKTKGKFISALSQLATIAFQYNPYTMGVKGVITAAGFATKHIGKGLEVEWLEHLGEGMQNLPDKAWEYLFKMVIDEAWQLENNVLSLFTWNIDQFIEDFLNPKLKANQDLLKKIICGTGSVDSTINSVQEKDAPNNICPEYQLNCINLVDNRFLYHDQKHLEDISQKTDIFKLYYNVCPQSSNDTDIYDPLLTQLYGVEKGKSSKLRYLSGESESQTRLRTAVLLFIKEIFKSLSDDEKAKLPEGVVLEQKDGVKEVKEPQYDLDSIFPYTTDEGYRTRDTRYGYRYTMAFPKDGSTLKGQMTDDKQILDVKDAVQLKKPKVYRWWGMDWEDEDQTDYGDVRFQQRDDTECPGNTFIYDWFKFVFVLNNFNNDIPISDLKSDPNFLKRIKKTFSFYNLNFGEMKEIYSDKSRIFERLNSGNFNFQDNDSQNCTIFPDSYRYQIGGNYEDVEIERRYTVEYQNNTIFTKKTNNPSETISIYKGVANDASRMLVEVPRSQIGYDANCRCKLCNPTGLNNNNDEQQLVTNWTPLKDDMVLTDGMCVSINYPDHIRYDEEGNEIPGGVKKYGLISLYDMIVKTQQNTNKLVRTEQEIANMKHNNKINEKEVAKVYGLSDEDMEWNKTRETVCEILTKNWTGTGFQMIGIESTLDPGALPELKENSKLMNGKLNLWPLFTDILSKGDCIETGDGNFPIDSTFETNNNTLLLSMYEFKKLINGESGNVEDSTIMPKLKIVYDEAKTAFEAIIEKEKQSEDPEIKDKVTNAELIPELTYDNPLCLVKTDSIYGEMSPKYIKNYIKQIRTKRQKMDEPSSIELSENNQIYTVRYNNYISERLHNYKERLNCLSYRQDSDKKYYIRVDKNNPDIDKVMLSKFEHDFGIIKLYNNNDNNDYGGNFGSLIIYRQNIVSKLRNSLKLNIDHTDIKSVIDGAERNVALEKECRLYLGAFSIVDFMCRIKTHLEGLTDDDLKKFLENDDYCNVLDKHELSITDVYERMNLIQGQEEIDLTQTINIDNGKSLEDIDNDTPTEDSDNQHRGSQKNKMQYNNIDQRLSRGDLKDLCASIIGIFKLKKTPSSGLKEPAVEFWSKIINPICQIYNQHIEIFKLLNKTISKTEDFDTHELDIKEIKKIWNKLHFILLESYDKDNVWSSQTKLDSDFILPKPGEYEKEFTIYEVNGDWCDSRRYSIFEYLTQYKVNNGKTISNIEKQTGLLEDKKFNSYFTNLVNSSGLNTLMDSEFGGAMIAAAKCAVVSKICMTALAAGITPYKLFLGAKSVVTGIHTASTALMTSWPLMWGGIAVLAIAGSKAMDMAHKNIKTWKAMSGGAQRFKKILENVTWALSLPWKLVSYIGGIIGDVFSVPLAFFSKMISGVTKPIKNAMSHALMQNKLMDIMNTLIESMVNPTSSLNKFMGGKQPIMNPLRINIYHGMLSLQGLNNRLNIGNSVMSAAIKANKDKIIANIAKFVGSTTVAPLRLVTKGVKKIGGDIISDKADSMADTAEEYVVTATTTTITSAMNFNEFIDDLCRTVSLISDPCMIWLFYMGIPLPPELYKNQIVMLNKLFNTVLKKDWEKKKFTDLSLEGNSTIENPASKSNENTIKDIVDKINNNPKFGPGGCVYLCEDETVKVPDDEKEDEKIDYTDFEQLYQVHIEGSKLDRINPLRGDILIELKDKLLKYQNKLLELDRKDPEIEINVEALDYLMSNINQNFYKTSIFNEIISQSDILIDPKNIYISDKDKRYIEIKIKKLKLMKEYYEVNKEDSKLLNDISPGDEVTIISSDDTLRSATDPFNKLDSSEIMSKSLQEATHPDDNNDFSVSDILGL